MAVCTSLPVLMYHYVNKCTGPITVTPDRFEEHCRGMAEHGWRGVSLDEAQDYLSGNASLPPRSVLITFDDGFLDNFVYAAPILERYGHKAVIFAVTDRLETAGALRPTLADVRNGQAAPVDLPPVDTPVELHALGYKYRQDMFMNWAEARQLDRTGIRIAAHTAGHLAVFAGPDFPVRSGDGYEQAGSRFHVPGWRGNTFYHIQADVPWGMPRFREQPAMSGPAFIPSGELTAAIRALVPQDKAGAHAFFQSPANVAALHELVDGFDAGALGSVESEAMQRQRVHAELTRCRDTLIRELDHPVASLCWPWGRGSDLALAEARDLGFSVFFTTRPGANPPGRPLAVHRFKVRDKGWPWLRTRLEVYSRPWLAGLYAKLKG